MDPSTIDDVIRPVLEGMASSQAAGFTFVVGLAGALWSASGYVGAFSRAMNRIYEISEGRPFWKLRPVMLLVTLIGVFLAATVLVMLVRLRPRGGVHRRRRSASATRPLFVWGIAKWPVLAFLVMCIVAMLYYATPNVQQPKFRWISVGAAVAIVIWVLASVAFAFYVGNFGSYDKTYGSLAGVIVALLWLWITNIALLFGAEVDSEMERGRELQAGHGRRGGAPAARPRHPQHREGAREGARGHRARAAHPRGRGRRRPTPRRSPGTGRQRLARRRSSPDARRCHGRRGRPPGCTPYAVSCRDPRPQPAGGPVALSPQAAAASRGPSWRSARPAPSSVRPSGASSGAGPS